MNIVHLKTKNTTLWGWSLGVRVVGWSLGGHFKKATTLKDLVLRVFRFGGVVTLLSTSGHPESPYSWGGRVVTTLYKSE